MFDILAQYNLLSALLFLSHMLRPVLPSYKVDRLGRHLWNKKSKLKHSSVIRQSDWQTCQPLFMHCLLLLFWCFRGLTIRLLNTWSSIFLLYKNGVILMASGLLYLCQHE